MSARDATFPVVPTIRVTNMAEALEFYVGVLGFELERGGPDEENPSRGTRPGEAHRAGLRPLAAGTCSSWLV
jgi:catechol 2,3-dioxygenase-like lactoylglutathione lyase family enzyme